MAAEKRTQISKKARFDIFKRDSFQCQYCGSSSPKVVLEVDHIIPVIEGGDNSIDNLLTSCFDCNRGKGKQSLTTVPKTLAQKHEEAIEKEEQYLAFIRYQKKINKRVNTEIEVVNDIYSSNFPEYELSETFKQSSLKKFISILGVQEVSNAMYKACMRVPNNNGSIKYFCGICWSTIKGGGYE